MKKNIKNCVALLAVLAMLPSVGCGGDGNSESWLESWSASSIADLAEVWSCHATVNVLQDKDIYDDVKEDAAINLMVAKGEYEASQLIVSALKNIDSYDLVTSTLTNAAGDTLSTEQVEVFHEKYIEIKSNFNGGITGMYPDAIVPLKNIQNVGEDKVASGDNQGIYVRYNIPVDQPAGVYQGTYTLKLEDFTMEIPVSVDVQDVVVSEVNHVKSAYCTFYGYYLGEQEGTQDMLNKYTEFLYDYRICNAQIIPPDGQFSDSDVELFVELAYEYMQNPKCSYVCIPYRVGGAAQDLDTATSTRFLKAMAQKSFETGFNMFEKAGAYIGSIDEPASNYPDEKVERTSAAWTNTCNAVADAIVADSTIDSPIKDEVVQGIRDCFNVVTAHDVERYAPLGVKTFVVAASIYDTEAGRESVDYGERWWYTCIYPRAPYANFQIDNALTSPIRLRGWQQAHYDIVGDLFWATDSYYEHRQHGLGSTTIYLEDYYSSPHRFPNTNGDGYLLYPGAPYGIDGPVATLRLEAIRDGFEEYEILLAMKEKYNEVGATLGENAFNADALFESLSASVYTGILPTGDTSDFTATRKAMFDLAVLNDSAANFYLVGYDDNRMGTKSFTFYTSKDATMTVNGDEITDKTELADGILWNVSVDLVKSVNNLDIVVSCGGKNYSYYLPLGGATITKNATDIQTTDIVSDVYASATLVDDPVINGKQAMKLELPMVEPGVEQALRLSGDFISIIDKDAQEANLVINVAEESSKGKFSIYGKFSKSVIMVDLVNAVELEEGTNNINISLSTLNWDKLGDLEYFFICIGGVDGEPARTVYLSSMTVYKK